jgi:hypothetical protein
MNENQISIFDPRTMDKITKRLPPVRTFLLDTFFKRKKTFTTKSIDMDFKKGGRALAPFVHPAIGGETIPNTGFETKSYTPPLVAPNKITTAGDLESRNAGENIYSGTTPAQRAVQKLAEDLGELNEMIVRRKEWMAAQSIFTGKIPIIGKGLKETVDFSFTNKETLDAAKRWNNDAADPIADLERWHEKVQKTGFTNCDVCIMATDVARAFINHKKVQKILDVTRIELAVIAPRQLPNGARYIGTIPMLGLDIYTYNEWYLDDWTDPKAHVQKPLVPDGTLALMSTSAAYSIYYGAVTMLMKQDSGKWITVEGEKIPQMRIAHNPDRQILQLNSKPLPVPHEVDSWFVAQVLATVP